MEIRSEQGLQNSGLVCKFGFLTRGNHWEITAACLPVKISSWSGHLTHAQKIRQALRDFVRGGQQTKAHVALLGQIQRIEPVELGNVFEQVAIVVESEPV